MKNYSFTSLSCLQSPNSFEFGGIQSTDSDVSMMTESQSGYLSNGSSDANYYQQLGDVSLDSPSQFPYFSPVTYPSMMPARSDEFGSVTSHSHLMEYNCSLPNDPSNKTHSLLVQPSDHHTTRKRTPENTIGQRNSVISNMRNLEASKMNKKRKAMEQLLNNTRHLKLQAPNNNRRSQKLSDKVSALQEIVCPYGKTDTASVLQETCIYITVFHQELRRLCVSYFETRSFMSQQQGNGEMQSCLGSKGLCLVPTSIMKSLTRESWGDQHQAASGKLRRHRIT